MSSNKSSSGRVKGSRRGAFFKCPHCGAENHVNRKLCVICLRENKSSGSGSKKSKSSQGLGRGALPSNPQMFPTEPLGFPPGSSMFPGGNTSMPPGAPMPPLGNPMFPPQMPQSRPKGKGKGKEKGSKKNYGSSASGKGKGNSAGFPSYPIPGAPFQDFGLGNMGMPPKSGGSSSQQSDSGFWFPESQVPGFSSGFAPPAGGFNGFPIEGDWLNPDFDFLNLGGDSSKNKKKKGKKRK